MPLVSDVFPIFKYKFKERYDSTFDQFHRIFMVKLILVMTLVTGINWYKDKINCLMPNEVLDFENDDEDFMKYISSTCWIQGVYIYKEFAEQSNMMAYYGIPQDMNAVGITLPDKQSCSPGQPFCKELEKVFYLQYQWLPFFLFGCACLYYLPYVLYKWINWDVFQLLSSLQKKPINYPAIKRRFFKPVLFDRNLNSLQMWNILVKLCYIIVNIIVFVVCNQIFNGDFFTYGSKWIRWNELNNTIQYDYMGKRDFPKPGNEFLPPFGFCELYLQAKDIKQTYNNKQKLVCEMSQNVLYQYAFILFWFAIMVGFCVSIIGLVFEIVKYLQRKLFHRFANGQSKKEKEVFKALTARQKEYLEIIFYRNKVAYGELIKFIYDTLK